MPALARNDSHEQALLERPIARGMLLGVLDRRVAIVAAPSGFGKTRLVQSLAQPGRPVLEIKADCTFEHFVANVVRSVAPLARGMSRSVAGMYAKAIENTQGPALLAQWFARYLTGSTRLLVIDGVDNAEDERISAFLQVAISTSPTNVHWILVGKDDETLKNLVAHEHDIVTVTREDLTLSFPEIRTLGKTIAPNHSDGEIFMIARKADGCISKVVFLLQCLEHGVPGVADPETTIEDILDRSFSNLSRQEQMETMTGVLLEDEGSVKTGKLANEINSVLSRLRTTAPWIFEPDRKNIQGSFRSRLREETRRLIDAGDTAIFIRAAEALEAQGDIAAAVALYWTVDAIDRLLAVVERCSGVGIEGEQMHVLREAIALMPSDLQTHHPLVIALRAVDAVNRGRYDEAVTLYEKALAYCPPGTRQQSIRYWYASAAISNGDTKLVKRLLEPKAELFQTPPALRATMLSLLAVSWALSGDLDRASRWVTRACKISDAQKDPLVAARVYQQATFVALQQKNLDLAHAHGEKAVRYAEICGWPHVAAITYGILHHIAVERGWPQQMAQYARALADHAGNAGNTSLQYLAVVACREHAVERNDTTEIAKLTYEVEQFNVYRSPELFDEGRPELQARAMEHAWEGNITLAFLRIAPLLDAHEHGPSDATSLPQAFSEAAVYAAAIGRRDQAFRALKLYRSAVANDRSSKNFMRARVHEGLALWLLGNETEATIVFRDIYSLLPHSEGRPRVRIYAEYVAAMIEFHTLPKTRYPTALEEELTAAGWGGIARMVNGVLSRFYAKPSPQLTILAKQMKRIKR